MEQTLVIVKSDGVMRGLCGEIVTRFERVGLKMVAARMVLPTKELAEKHYPVDRESFINGMGKKTLENYGKLGIDPVAKIGTDNPHEIGLKIRGWLIEYLTDAPVLAFVLEGPHAVELVRKMCGHTLPLNSAPGTIRGDLAYDSSYLANTASRAIKNLIHASGEVEEAQYEIPLWFANDQIFAYERVEEKVMK